MTGRIQLALNVDDLDESIVFYSKLFGAAPAKVRHGYANFAIADPPLKLILMENRGQGGSLNHLGVEVADTDAVDAEQRRLAEALPQSTSATPPAATPGRTSSGSRARPTGSGGRSTRPGGQPDLLGPGRQPEPDAAEAALEASGPAASTGACCVGADERGQMDRFARHGVLLAGAP